MCMTSLGNVSIGCNSRYHPTRVCLGLPHYVIDTIKEYGGRGNTTSNLAVLLMVVDV